MADDKSKRARGASAPARTVEVWQFVSRLSRLARKRLPVRRPAGRQYPTPRPILANYRNCALTAAKQSPPTAIGVHNRLTIRSPGGLDSPRVRTADAVRPLGNPPQEGV